MLAPVTPHICEELWEKMGGEGFVSLASWPKPDEAKVDIRAEESEALIMSTLEDTLNIIKATGLEPKQICYYTSTQWKWHVYLKALEMAEKGPIKTGELIKELMSRPDLKKVAQNVAKYAQRVVEVVNVMAPEARWRKLEVGAIDENRLLSEAQAFFKREFNADITVFSEDDPRRYDPKSRAHLAEPYRPAIYIE